ncbi:SCP2 sterol-binding domain-containing protein [Actinomadura miaoliensis]|uniref:SCP2 domain-containing protein n=1 Tax=Actinomadura miaoliensis TaxID=430685 RepID=A0ABP7VBP6_9ACTN
MNATPASGAGGQEAVQRSLENLASRLEKTRGLRDGHALLHLSGAGGGTYVLSTQRGEAAVSRSEAGAVRSDEPPVVEVMGDAETVRAILDGEIDARERFLQGGLQVRGDLRYLSDVALELGLLKHPL